MIVPPASLTTASVPLQLLAECVVSGEEEPALAALLEDCLRGAVGERRRVVAVVDHVGRAVLAGQRSARRGDGEEWIFFSLETAAIARLTPVLEPPSCMFRPSVSAHSRSFCDARAGLF